MRSARAHGIPHRSTRPGARRAAPAALVVLLAATGVALAVLLSGGEGGEEPRGAPEPAPPAAPRAAPPAPTAGSDERTRPAARIPLRELAGQRLVVGFQGTSAPRSILRRARRGEIGGVILFARNVRTRTQVRRMVDRLQRWARAGGNPPLLVTVDQEGGLVKRFPGAPPSAAARALGGGDAAATRREGRATGAWLRRAGVNVNLAPVLDVPTTPGAFIWRERRAFSLRARTVAEHGVAFIEGLQDAGVAATAKHFPGLGDGLRNTDGARQTLTPTARERRLGLFPFRRAVRAGVRLVMLSNAAYPAWDRRARPAPYSRPVIDLLRRDLGFDGVVVSDSLDAVAARAGGPNRAVRAARAGVDLLLFTGTGEGHLRRVMRSARNGRPGRRALEASHRRILRLKESLSG